MFTLSQKIIDSWSSRLAVVLTLLVVSGVASADDDHWQGSFKVDPHRVGFYSQTQNFPYSFTITHAGKGMLTIGGGDENSINSSARWYRGYQPTLEDIRDLRSYFESLRQEAMDDENLMSIDFDWNVESFSSAKDVFFVTNEPISKLSALEYEEARSAHYEGAYDVTPTYLYERSEWHLWYHVHNGYLVYPYGYEIGSEWYSPYYRYHFVTLYPEYRYNSCYFHEGLPWDWHRHGYYVGITFGGFHYEEHRWSNSSWQHNWENRYRRGEYTPVWRRSEWHAPYRGSEHHGSRPSEYGGHSPVRGGERNPPRGEYNPPRGGERNPPRGEYNPPRGGERNPPRGEYNPPRGGERHPPRGEYNPPRGGERNPPRGGERNPPRGGERNPPRSGNSGSERTPPSTGGNSGGSGHTGGKRP